MGLQWGPLGELSRSGGAMPYAALSRIAGAVAAVGVLLACSSAQPRQSTDNRPQTGATTAAQRGPTTIVVGIRNDIQGFSLMAGDTTAGGWQSAQEIVAQGLITSDRDSRNPVPRI